MIKHLSIIEHPLYIEEQPLLHELCLVMGCNCHTFYYTKLKDMMGELNPVGGRGGAGG
jgi:hypothetical protein